MDNAYETALNDAKRALTEVNTQIAELDLKRAKLMQTVAVLQSQLGLPAENATSLTDAILLVIKGWPGCATAAQVIDRLFMMGYEVQAASVATILSRLAKQGKVMARLAQDRKSVGYEWFMDTTRAERLTAQKELASKAPKK